MTPQHKAKLTKTRVERYPLAETDYVVWDTELRGFGVRVRPSGKRSYFLKYRVGGGRGGTARKPTIGAHGAITCDEARAIAKEWLAEVVKGGDPGGARVNKRRSLPVSNLCDRYMIEYAEPHKKASSIAEDQRLIDGRIRPALGSRKVLDLSRPDVMRFHQSLRSTPIEANRALALLSKMFNLAEVWGLRPDGSNPCRHVKRYAEKKRERFLSADELARLGKVLAEAEGAQAVPASAIAAIRLLALTGCRHSEIVTLPWGHVDWERSCLRLPSTKTGGHVVHLNAAALEVLQGIRRDPDDPFVIAGNKPGAPLTNLHRHWHNIRKRAKLTDVRLHDLRHGFASVGAAGGLSLPVIGALLGHTQAATTQRYAHLSADPLKQATEMIGERIAAAMRGEKAEVVELRRRRR